MLLRSRFLWRLFVGFAGAVVVTGLAVFALVLPRVEQDALRDLEQRLVDQAVLVRAVLGEGELEAEDLRTRVERIRAQATAAQGARGPESAAGGSIATRLSVIAADGRVLADSVVESSTLENHANRPEILAAKASGHGTVVRPSTAMGREQMYVALAIRGAGGELRGYVRTAGSLVDVERRLARLRRQIGLAVLAGTLLGWLLSFVIARSVAGPVLDLATAAESIARGDYRRRVEVSTRDELGRLAQTVNTTSAQLAAQLETIAHDRERLAAILGSMVEGVIAVDREERVVHLNVAAARFLEADDAALVVGRPLYEVTRVPEIGEALSEAIAKGVSVRRTLTLGRGQKERVLELLAAPLRNGGGRAGGGVLVLHDTTQLHKLEGIRRQFVSNVSHELKTPLTAIRGLVETLLDAEDIDGATRRHFLERINSQTSRLVSLVADLLSLSRIEAGDAASERRPIDLRVPVLESVRALRGTSERRQVVLLTDLPSGPVVVLAEDEGLRQAISNLIDNAIKYSPEGSPVEVRLRTEGGSVVLEVADRGVGIPEEHQERIFERFYRVDPARSRELGGTGLGLAIVKNVALGLGGEVDVRSQPGRGSTFTVRLPLAPAPAPVFTESS